MAWAARKNGDEREGENVKVRKALTHALAFDSNDPACAGDKGGRHTSYPLAGLDQGFQVQASLYHSFRPPLRPACGRTYFADQESLHFRYPIHGVGNTNQVQREEHRGTDQDE